MAYILDNGQVHRGRDHTLRVEGRGDIFPEDLRPGDVVVRRVLMTNDVWRTAENRVLRQIECEDCGMGFLAYDLLHTPQECIVFQVMGS